MKKKKKKNSPVVNITLNIRELIKQDALEKSFEEPKNRFKKVGGDSKEEAMLKKRIEKGDFDVSDGIFMKTFDLMMQPNKKEKDRIPSKEPKYKTNENTFLSTAKRMKDIKKQEKEKKKEKKNRKKII